MQRQLVGVVALAGHRRRHDCCNEQSCQAERQLTQGEARYDVVDIATGLARHVFGQCKGLVANGEDILFPRAKHVHGLCRYCAVCGVRDRTGRRFAAVKGVLEAHFQLRILFGLGIADGSLMRGIVEKWRRLKQVENENEDTDQQYEGLQGNLPVRTHQE